MLLIKIHTNNTESCRSEHSEERATAEEERNDSKVTGWLPSVSPEKR